MRWAATAGRTVVSVLLLAAAAPAPGLPDLQQAQRARAADIAAQQAAQARSIDIEQQAQRLAGRRVDAAARLLATEQALAAAGQRVDALARRSQAAERLLEADSRTLVPLLPLLQRLSLYPAETLLAAPGSPEDAVRGVLVLGGLARQLRERAARVAAERQTAADLRAQLDAAMPALHAAEAAQRGQAAALDAALAQAHAADTTAQLQGELAARRAATDAARAETLRQAIAALDAARLAAARRQARADRIAERIAARIAGAHNAVPVAAAVPVPPMTARGAWATPAAGRIVRPFGEAGDAGPASGVTYQTPPGARVVAPCSGRVEFAAPFRSYGLLVIIGCGGDTHVVLSGLQRLDAASGQAVQAGEPVGVMAPAAGGAPLYMELRRGGAAVDPAPYLRAAS